MRQVLLLAQGPVKARTPSPKAESLQVGNSYAEKEAASACLRRVAGDRFSFDFSFREEYTESWD